MSKRANGEGSISPVYKKDENGNKTKQISHYLIQYTAGKKVDGSPNRKTTSAKTMKEAVKKKKEFEEKYKNIKYVNSEKITIFEMANRIVNNKYEANIISGNTYYRDLDILKHIKESFIGDIYIVDVTSDDVQKFLNLKTNYAKSTIKKITQLLNQVFKESIKQDIISKNPISFITQPKSNKLTKEIDALSIEEQKAFTNVLKTEHYKNIFLIALHSGMRIGEILALIPEDIDFENSKIHIKNTLTRDDNGKVIVGDRTKTPTGMRDIPLTAVLKPLFEDVLSNYIPNPNNLLFVHSNGNIIMPSTINSQFKRICKNAGIKTKTVKKKKGIDKDGNDKYVSLKTSNTHTHMLRHTYATRCIEAGIPAEVLQKLLGHKDISITINTYTTIFDKFKNDTLEKYTDYIKNI